MLVLTEGVIPYLSNDRVATLVRELRQIKGAKFLIADYDPPEAIRYRRRKRGLTRLIKNAPFRFEPKDWFQFFAECGWRPREIRNVADEAERRNRPLPRPRLRHAMALIRNAFIRRERQQASRRFAAYVLLEPK